MTAELKPCQKYDWDNAEHFIEVLNVDIEIKSGATARLSNRAEDYIRDLFAQKQSSEQSLQSKISRMTQATESLLSALQWVHDNPHIAHGAGARTRVWAKEQMDAANKIIKGES